MGKHWTPRLWSPKDGKKPTSEQISRIARYKGVTSREYQVALETYYAKPNFMQQMLLDSKGH